MKRKIIQCGILVAVLVAVVVYFSPKPLIRDVEDSEVISMYYRADTWDVLHFFYPCEACPSFDEGELLEILHESKAIVELIPRTFSNTTPHGAVTLMITVGEGERTKNIQLGEWNRLTIDHDGYPAYRILNADALLERLLEFLQIDEHADLSWMQPTAR